MRNLTHILWIAAVMAVVAHLFAIPLRGQVAPTAVSPDRHAAGEAPVLTPEERERLLSLTRVVITPAATHPDAADDNGRLPPEKAAELEKQIEAADALLGKLSVDKSPAASQAMMRLMDSREPGIRATALRWLAGRADVRAKAITRGFRDRSATVRLMAEQMLVENGVPDDALARVKSAREAGSPTLAREIRSALDAATAHRLP